MARGENALEHQSRKMIYEYIYSHPDAAFNTLRTFLNIHPSTLMYHLTYLERAGKITCRNEGGHNYYTCRLQSQLDMTSFQRSKFNTLSESQKRLIGMINENPGITKKELILKTRIKGRSLNYHIKKLIGLKFLWEVNNGSEMGYEVITKEKLNQEMFNRLLKKLLKEEITEEQFHKIKKKLEELELEDIIK
jgi:predicted transcriptional regulator